MSKYSLSRYKLSSLYFFLYFSLLIGFFFNEDLSGGAKTDFFFIIRSLETIFQNGVIYYILELNKLTTLQQTPTYYILIYFLKDNLKNLEFIRFFLLHMFLIFPIIFYYLSREFEIKKEISKYIPIIFFISPYFRSMYIWAGSILLALIFFSMSLLFFKKFEKKNKILNLYISLTFLIVASYIRPELGLIISYYFIIVFKKLNLENIIKILFFCFILSLPFLYYYFFIINFSLNKYGITSNIIKNFTFFLSVFLFYLIPFLIFDKKRFYNFTIFIKKNLLIFILINIFFLLFLKTISLPEIGGGVFFKLSIISKIQSLFFIFPSLGVFVFGFLLFKNLKFKEISKEVFILIIFLIQTSINIYFFQKYLDLLYIFYFLFIFSNKLFLNSFNEKNFVIKFISFYLIFYISNFIYYY